jgi:hypothetical protein
VDLLWDHLYGLLDAEQERTLHLHVSGCPVCQAALTRCTKQQQLVARAARMYDTLAPFVPPDDEVPARQATSTEPISQGTHVAMPRRRRPRRWPVLAAAASLLLAIGGIAWYQQTLGQLQESRHDALAAVDATAKRGEKDARETANKLAALPRTVGSEGVHLKLLGSAIIQDGAPSVYRGAARDLNGEPVPGGVTARVVAVSKKERSRRRVLSEQKVAAKGDFAFSLPAHLDIPADSDAFLEVEARGRRSLARLSDKIAVAGPVFRTQLAIDKTRYRTGEVLYFRSLTLNPFANKPPEKPLAVVTTVTDSRGARRAFTRGLTRADGAGGGAFALTDDISAGQCTLEMIELEGRFPPVVRTFNLVREQAPQLDKNLVFDRSVYRPGDDLNASFRAKRLKNGAAVANRNVTAQVVVDDAKAAAPAAASRTNAKGEANFKLKLPPRIPGGKADLEIRVNDGKETETIIRSIPVVVSKQQGDAQAIHGEIELFPEGGQMVDGLASRVFFRARTDLGKPIDLKGTVVDAQGREVARFQTKGQRGLGFFSFTPSAGEKYGLKVIAPMGTFKTSFPQVRKKGVVLTLEREASTEGEPVALTVSQKRDGKRTLVVAAISHGNLVDQQVVSASETVARVRLMPPAGVTGVIRVTAYEARAEGLVPLAERLIYRSPVRRLDIAVGADKDAYTPGSRVSLTIRTRDEASAPVSGVVLASVVDVDALTARAQSASDFFLASELRRPEDLEEMDIVVRNAPQARAALDLFLATQGWRRFGEGRQGVGASSVLVKKTATVPQRSAARPGLALLSLDNAVQAEEQYQKELKTARDQLIYIGRERTSELNDEIKQLTLDVARAEDHLMAFRDLPRQALGYAFVVLVALLLTAGCIALFIAVARVVRSTGVTTPYFATSFACLLLCLVVLLGGRLQGPPIGGSHAGLDDLASARLLGTRLEAFAGALNNERGEVEEAVPGGQFAAVPGSKGDAAKPEANARNSAAHDKTQDRQGTYGARGLQGFAGSKKKTDAGESGSPAGGLQRRQFEALKEAQRARSLGAGKGGAKAPLAPQAPVSRHSAAAAKIAKDEPRKDDRRKSENGGAWRVTAESAPVEYAHIHARGNAAPDLQETVLWAPLINTGRGTATVLFDLSDKITTYRILILGHTTDGRLGMVQGKLKTEPATSTSQPAKAK